MEQLLNIIIIVLIILILFCSMGIICYCYKDDFIDTFNPLLNKKFDLNQLSNKNRLEYYLNNLNTKHIIDKDNIKQDKAHFIIDNYFIKNNSVKNLGDYYDEIIKYTKNKKIVYFIHGDVQHNSLFPALTKTRPLYGKNNILIKLNVRRHWGVIDKIKEIDIPYDLKDNKIIWRGVNSGDGIRLRLVKKFYNNKNPLIDVGLTEVSKYEKKEMSKRNMLKSKFIISIRGNDVATNLKWIMSSNSLCFMPKKQKYVSWFMEDKLIPWYHYIPLEDNFSDLEYNYKWCLNNPEKCKKIIKNANDYIKVFLNKKNEDLLISQVVDTYNKFITIN